MNKIKEKFLISCVQKGDAEAFGEIYDEYIKRVYQFIFFRVPNQEIAQDLSHDVFVKLLDYIKNKDQNIQHLQALIYKICRTQLAEYYSSHQLANDKALELNEAIDQQFDHSLKREEKIEQQIDIKIDLRIALDYIKKIKNIEYQDVIILRFIEDLSFRQIAQIMDKTPSALRVLLHRALKELKQKIDQQDKKQ